MPLLSSVLNAANDGATPILSWAAIHSSAASDSQVSNERVALMWNASVGDAAIVGNVPLAFTGAPSGPATHLGIWSAQVGGDFRGSSPLTGAQAFDSAGDYSVTAVTLTAVSV